MVKLALALCAFLGLSVLVNIMTFRRLSNGDAPKSPPRKTAALPRATEDVPAPVVTGDKTDYLIHEIARLRREVAEIKAAAPDEVASRPASPAAPRTTATRDPEIAAILAEQDRFNQFWGDLHKLSGARKQIEEARYIHAVIESTADFLGLAEPQRSQFAETARLAVGDLEAANKDYQAASKNIVYDKANPKAYQDQWAAVNKTYGDAKNAVYDRVKSQLDSSQPRQKQFMTGLDGWFRYIAPVQPSHRREGGLKAVDHSWHSEGR